MADRRTVAHEAAAEPLRPLPVQAIDAAPRASGRAVKRRNRGGRPEFDVLDGHLGYFLRRAQVSVFQDFIRTLASLDIRPAQYSVLVVIGCNPGLSQADVSELLGIERARLVRLLDRLDRRGLTRRLSSRADRRSHELQLTSEGRRLLKRAKTLAAIHEARLLAQLGSGTHKMIMEALRDFHL
jgi:DNA-binding MarR family transcriptional regulator